MITLEIEPGNGTSFFSFFDPWINRVWRRGTLRIQQRGSRVDIRWSVIWERIIVCWFGMTSTCVFCEMCIKKVGEAQWYMEYHQLYMVYPGLYRYICYVIYIYIHTHTVFDYICNVYIIIYIYILVGLMVDSKLLNHLCYMECSIKPCMPWGTAGARQSLWPHSPCRWELAASAKLAQKGGIWVAPESCF